MMDKKNGGSKILYIALIFLLILSTAFSVSLFRYMKEMQSEFEKEKSAFVRKNADLADTNKKIEKDLHGLEDSMIIIESQNRAILEQKKLLKKENLFLRNDIKAIKNRPVLKLFEDALAAESNENIKKVMQQAIERIDMIMSGKVVSLEPILITENWAATPEESRKAFSALANTGTILSIDRNNNLIAIDLGGKDNAREGQRYAIFHGDEELGSAEIISVRRDVSAAVIDAIKPLHTISDIEKGDGVILRE